MLKTNIEFFDRPAGRVLLFIALVVMIAFIYHDAWHIPYFADDFQWVTTHPSSTILGCFIHTLGADNTWYRPVQAMLLSIIQTLWRFDTFPIRIAEILVHAIGAVLIFHILRTLKLSSAASLLGAVFFAVAQVAAFPVIGNDFLSQMLSGLFCLSTLWLLYRAKGNWRSSRYYFAVVTYVLALLSKEASAGLIIGVAFMLLFTAADKTWNAKLQSAAVRTLPFVLLLGGYMVLRMSIGASAPSFQSGTYGFRFGINIFKNAALFIMQAALPTSSLAVARNVYYREWLSLTATAIFMALFALIVIWGSLRSQWKPLLGFIMLFAGISLVPVIFLNHVSEAYLYNALPYISILVAIAADSYFSGAQEHKRFPTFALGVLILALITNIFGDLDKARCMSADGNRGNHLLTQFYPIVKSSPPNSYLYFIHPMKGGFAYSGFAQPGFRVCTNADGWVARYTERPDVSLRILEDSEYVDSVKIHPGVAFTYDTVTLKLKPLF